MGDTIKTRVVQCVKRNNNDGEEYNSLNLSLNLTGSEVKGDNVKLLRMHHFQEIILICSLGWRCLLNS